MSKNFTLKNIETVKAQRTDNVNNNLLIYPLFAKTQLITLLCVLIHSYRF